MKTFPIMLDLRGRRVVVIGGGAVGERKIKALLEAGANVTLVDPMAQSMSAPGPGELTVLREPYRQEQLQGAFLAFACTNDHELNEEIAHEAHLFGAIVNAADQPEDCDFYLPAVFSQGDITVAVGTGGASPALAADIKRRLAEALPPKMAEFAAELARLRDELRGKVADIDRRGRIMKALSAPEAYEAFASGGPERLRAMYDGLLSM